MDLPHLLDETRLKNSAALLCKVLHPNLMFALAVAVAAHSIVPAFGGWLRWWALAVIPALALPQLYMQLRARYLRRHGKDLEGSLRDYFRSSPFEMQNAALLFSIPAVLLLVWLDAPELLLAVVCGGGVTTIIIALVNWVYRASYHLGVFTAAMTVLVLVAGLPVLVMLGLMVILGIARHLIGEHTPAQMLTGSAIGLASVLGGFYVFGLSL